MNYCSKLMFYTTKTTIKSKNSPEITVSKFSKFNNINSLSQGLTAHWIRAFLYF